MSRKPKRAQPSDEAVERFRAAVLAWFGTHGRDFPWRDAKADLYSRCISELLLQRTQANVVAGFVGPFVERFPSWSSLVDAERDELETVLQPIGLHRRRATSLQALAREMIRSGGRIPLSREEVERLPGVGQYMASALLALAHGQAEPFLDANMARVLERYFGPRDLVDIRYDPYLQGLSRRVTEPGPALDINFAVLDLAALVCTLRSPRCEVCPVAAGCFYAASSGAAATSSHVQ